MTSRLCRVWRWTLLNLYDAYCRFQLGVFNAVSHSASLSVCLSVTLANVDINSPLVTFPLTPSASFEWSPWLCTLHYCSTRIQKVTHCVNGLHVYAQGKTSTLAFLQRFWSILATSHVRHRSSATALSAFIIHHDSDTMHTTARPIHVMTAEINGVIALTLNNGFQQHVRSLCYEILIHQQIDKW